MNGTLSENDFQEILERKKEMEGGSVQPLPLQRVILPPNPFPFEALGPILGLAAQRIHEVIQTSDAIAAQSVLSAAAFATQSFADIHIDGRVYPLSLFLLTVAESGDRKSAADRIAVKPIYEYEQMLAQRYRKEKESYQIHREAWGQQKQAILQEGGERLHKSLLKHQETLSLPPLKPTCLVEEPTFEGLQCLFEEGRPSLGLFCDEGGRMFGGFSMNKEELLKTAAGLSSFWDGKPSTRVRAKGESIILYGKRFSLHLMMQESVFNRVFSNELLKTQGFLARCLVVYPESMIGKRRYQDVNLADDPALKTYFQSLSDLLNKPFLLKNPNVPNELQPKKIEMEKKAKGIWIDFHNELDKRLLSSGDFHSIRRFASKAPEQVLRIAGILTVFYQNDFSFVSEGTIKQAIELVDFYLNEAARIEGLNQTNGYLELAQESLLWLENYQRKTNEQSIPISTLYQKGPLKVRNKNLALKVLFVLQDHGYGQIINNQEYKGKRHRIVWVPRLVDKMSC